MAICLPSIHFCNFCPYSISIGIIYSYESSTKEKVYFGKTISMFAGFIQLQAPQRMGNIRLLMIFVLYAEPGYIEKEWVVVFFQVTTQNILLFISCQGTLSKFLYIKPNPYYRHFSILEFSEGFSAPKFLI